MAEKSNSEKPGRRKFLKKELLTGAGTLIGTGVVSSCSQEKSGESSEKVKLMTTEGKLVEVE